MPAICYVQEIEEHVTRGRRFHDVPVRPKLQVSASYRILVFTMELLYRWNRFHCRLERIPAGITCASLKSQNAEEELELTAIARTLKYDVERIEKIEGALNKFW